MLLRHAHRVWEEHSRELGLPVILLDAPAADESTLNDVAKSAVALEVALELDEDGAPSPSELALAVSNSESSHVLNLQLKQALPDSFYRISDNLKDRDDKLETSEDPASPSQSDQAEADGQKNSDSIVLGRAGLNPVAPWCCPTLHQADVINQQILCLLLNEGKDRPTVRHKTKVKLGEKGVAASVSWPLLTASQDQKINDMIRERTLQL